MMNLLTTPYSSMVNSLYTRSNLKFAEDNLANGESAGFQKERYNDMVFFSI